MEFGYTSGTAAAQKVGCLVAGVIQSRRFSPTAQAVNEASSGQLAKLMRAAGFEGAAGKSLVLNNVNGVAAERVLLVGLGKGATSARNYRRACGAAAAALKACGARSALWCLHEVEVAEQALAWRLHHAVVALNAAAYRFDRLKSKKDDNASPSLTEVKISVASRSERTKAEKAVVQANAIAQGVALAKDLGNLPSNICTPSYLAQQASALAKANKKITCKVLGEPEMKRLGMGSLLSVSRGSAESPQFIIMEYTGARKGSPTVVLVGKGVTFDSGGISIKPSAQMDEMKYDMCGAASVLGTFKAIAEMDLGLRVVGLVPCVENMPSGTASKPGDVITSMSGRTIEILNTDAEGRLILSDALTYAERYEPAAVIDIATLTGACVVALGGEASGLWSNDQALADEILGAGQYAGDRAWQMPLWEEYGEALRSNFADVANVGGREAGAITAAHFLSGFAGAYSWAHLDVAGTAWLGGKRKGATGRPVGLLARLLCARAGA
ncbi:MAG: leucyl aminopeptidase [Gammaproteobacteria bacterium]